MNTNTTTPLEEMNEHDYKILSTIQPAILKGDYETKEAALDSFFRTFDISECRDYASELLEGWAINHSVDEKDSDKVCMMFIFYHQLNVLFEAAFLTYRENRRKDGTHDDAGIPINQNLKCACADTTEESKTKVVTMVPSYTLQQALEIIVPIAQPNLVFLVGQFPDFLNDNKPSYDLLLVLQDSNKKILDQYRNIIRDAFIGPSPVHVTFSTTESLNTAISQRQIFLSRKCNPANLVYQKNAAFSIPVVPHDLYHPDIISRASRIFNAGLENVKSFLSATRELIANQNYKLAAFMLHQVVEHTLRPAIFTILDQKKQTHNLFALIMMARLFLPESVADLKLDQEENRSLFELLNNAYVEARYNNDFHVSEQSIKSLLSIVEEFADDVEAEHEDYLHSAN